MHRADIVVVIGLLLAPCVLFAAFIGHPWLCAGLAAAALAVPVSVWRYGRARPRRAALPAGFAIAVACAVAAVALTTLGGEGRLLPATPDWLTRDAVLRDLVRQHWPFVYRIDGEDWVLRAPLGMYLVPAVVGKVGGLRLGHLALWAQNSLALFAVLRVFCAGGPLRRSLVVLVVFCGFGGWDMVATLAVAARDTLASGAPFRLPEDSQWWAVLFQYSSVMTLAFWVPNHALGGWFVAALLLLRERGQVRIGTLAAGAGLSVLWSPFALMGALPFLLKAGAEAWRRREIAAGDVGMAVGAALALLPVALYLTGDSAAVSRGFQPWTRAFLGDYAAFMALEVLPFVAVNLLAGNLLAGKLLADGLRANVSAADASPAGALPADAVAVDVLRADALAADGGGGFSRSSYRLAVVMLVLIPFYRINVSNDFAMRASIPALAVLAVTTGHTAWAVLRRGLTRRGVLVAAVLGLGALTGLDQVRHVLMRRNTGWSTCDFVQAWYQSPYSAQMSPAIYLARLARMPAMVRAERPQVRVTGPVESRCVDQRLSLERG